MKKILDEYFYQTKWEKENIYNYNPADKGKTFIIDTPPPTVSGSLHIGHVFSYTQTDILARFQRMRGKSVFYPMGWDNNGLPTERRVQNLYKIICNPTLSNTDDPAFEKLLNRKDQKKISSFHAVSRKTFVRVCSKQSQEDQQKYEQLWRKLGLSVDWSQTYETISPHSQFISQRSFLDLYRKGFVENRYTPVFWDTQFKTAVAQADIEDRKQEGFYYNIKFQIHKGEGEFVISTTRPELLPACVALAAHPEDERYKKFFYKRGISPLFSAVVPVIPSTHADPEKGTGILMICSFGDMEDVRFLEKHNLPLKQIISPEGFLKEIIFKSFAESAEKNPEKELKLSRDFSGKFKESSSYNSHTENNFSSIQPDQANGYYAELKGLRIQQARKKIVEILAETKHLVSPPQPTEQFVKFYEKGDYPLELIPARQWYIKILQYKDELLQQGRSIKWHPPFMLKRYEQWVEGLNQDWCISRQRFFGVPFPVWYPLDKNKTPDYSNPILPYSSFFSNDENGTKVSAPVDPMSSAPAHGHPNWKHYTEEQRGKAGGFIADTAVMDTWATSSLTPQISSHWGRDKERHKKLFPADLRPQAHEIIRTWAFYTIVKSFFHDDFSEDKTKAHSGREAPPHKNIPWKHIAISGWVMNPQRLKVSKSKGGSIISPEELIEEYSADAIRYWAGKARLGMDTVYDENMFKTGRRLAVKLNNAFKFVQLFTQYQKERECKDSQFISSTGFYIDTAIDRTWMIYLLDMYQKAAAYLEVFHYSQALDLVEKGFWLFCDNYLELVKGRAYQLTRLEEAAQENSKEENQQNKSRALSAVYSLDLSVYIFIKMLAPYMPYITEHIWSSRYAKTENGESSIHTSLWLSVERPLLNFKKNSKDFLFNSNNLLNFSFNLLEQIRNIKAAQQKSLSTPVKELRIKSGREDKAMFDFCREDIARAAHVKSENIVFIEDSKKESPEVFLVLEG